MNLRDVLQGIRDFSQKIFILFSFLSVLIFNSCDDEATFLGRDLMPSADDLITRYSEESEILTNTESSRPELTSTTPRALLGDYYDPLFGNSRGEFMTRFEVTNTNFEPEYTVDSMILYLSIDDVFGDSLAAQTLRVYELTDTLSQDTVYYSDYSPEGRYDPVELANAVFSPTDSIIKVVINDPEFIQKFQEADDTVYKSRSEFYDFFYGFYLKTDETPDEGAIITVDLTSGNSKFSMFYHLPDSVNSTELIMWVGEFTPKVNLFIADYSDSWAEGFVDNPSVEDTLLYISGMAGIDTRISFPDIEDWLNKKPLAINRAELIIPVEDTATTMQSRDDFPEKLSLFSVNEEDKYSFLYDYRADGSPEKTYFDGAYDPADQAYSFNIGVHLQSFIQGDIDKLNLILRVNQSSINPNRVILKGPDATENKMRLKITYTEF